MTGQSVLLTKSTHIAAVILTIAALQSWAYAGTGISIATERNGYVSGDTINASLSASNWGDAIGVDVYVGLVSPDGGVYAFGAGGWSPILSPWAADLFLPAGFQVEDVPIVSIDVPSEIPPIADEGLYLFAAGLAHSGTLDFVCDMGFAEFEIRSGTRSHVYVNAYTGDNANAGTSDSPFRTITFALGSVEGSENSPVTVHLAPGTYATITNGESFPLNMKSWVSLSGAGTSSTILDAASSATRVICCDGVDGVLIERLAITGGTAFGEGPDGHGAGICSKGSSIEIVNCAVVGNAAHGDGAGIYCEGGSVRVLCSIISDNQCQGIDGSGGGVCCVRSSLEARDNTMWHNFAWNGGAVFCDQDSSAAIERNQLQYNQADNGGAVFCEGCSATIADNSIMYGYAMFGPGIWSVGGSPTIARNRIEGNRGGHGGGVGIHSGSPVIEDNRITANSVYMLGGGLCCMNASGLIRGNEITNNSAYIGAGIYCEDSSALTIRDNTITGCAGSGISCWSCSPTIDNNTIAEHSSTGILCDSMSSPTVRNNTVVRNALGGIWVTGGGSPTIVDCIIWANTDDLKDCSATFSCVGDEDDGEGNIHEAPLFVSGPFGDYYLDPASPCIDSGAQSADEAGLADMTTQAGGPSDAGIVDMGRHYRLQTGERPVAHIDLISPNPIEADQGQIEFIGSASDAEGAVQAYEWASSRDGVLSRESSFEIDAAELTTGTHKISFKAQDGDGQWSVADTEILAIGPETMRYFFVDAQLGSDLNAGSQESPFKTITYALASVEASEASPATIHVTAGIYSVSSNGESFPLEMKSHVSLFGDNLCTTILDAEDAAPHVVVFSAAADLTLEGFTITGGRADGEGEDQYGGGIYCSTLSPVIRGNRIVGNWARLGGGVALLEDRAEFENNLVANNTATDGGGLCGLDSRAQLSDNMFTNNAATNGAGVFSSASSLRIRDNRFNYNSASGNGGGLYCLEGRPTVEGNVFNSNAAANGGGASCQDSSARLTENYFTLNEAHNGGSIYLAGAISSTVEQNQIVQSAAVNGGGVYILACSPDVYVNAFLQNVAVMGGAIYFEEVGPAEVLHNTIDENEADYGGAICCSNSSPSIYNNSIRANRAANGGGMLILSGGSPQVEDNEIWGNSADGFGGGVCIAYDSTPRLLQNSILSNSASEGGGVFCISSSPSIHNNVILRNAADAVGGGLSFELGGSPQVSSCTVIGNSARDLLGDGIYCAGCALTVVDSIIWANGDDLWGCSASYCCIEDADEGEGNIHGDPMFVSGPFGDYYLDPESPCVDAGSRSAEEAELDNMTTQADRTLDSGVVDIGYHYPWR